MKEANTYSLEALSNDRHCWNKVSLQWKQPILCKAYCEALSLTDFIDSPPKPDDDNLQDEAGDNPDDFREYLSENGENESHK